MGPFSNSLPVVLLSEPMADEDASSVLNSSTLNPTP